VYHKDDGKRKGYDYYCYRISKAADCDKVDHPLEFVEVEKDVYSLVGLNTDMELVARI
jgi:hypothetical protein